MAWNVWKAVIQTNSLIMTRPPGAYMAMNYCSETEERRLRHDCGDKV